MQALVGYFGETRAEPCGHCSFCLDGHAAVLPEPAPQPAIERLLDTDGLAQITAANPDALGQPRQRARLLCGIASPATTRAKLTRDPLFGVLAERRFADVLAWCIANRPD